MPVKLYVDGVLKDTLQVPYGTRPQLPTYTKNGYHFDGWYKNSSYTLSFSSNSIIDDPIDLYGRFLPNEYHISLNANGGSVSKTSIPVNYGGSYSLPDASRNGYTFDGWYDSNSRRYSSGTYNLTSDLFLTAKWTIVNYSISYELNGGEANSLKPSYTVEESFTLPLPSKTGYTFIGWNTSNSSTGASKSYSIQKGTTGNKKFYAIWNANTYHLHLDVNGGNSLVTTDYDITFDSTFTLPMPTREHYNFVSWTYNGTNVSSGRWKYTSDVTFVAKWEVKTYSISYQLNGGTNNSSNPSKYSYFDSFTLKEPSKTGYSFVGWTGTGINEITKNVSITYGSTGNRSYTANWSVNTYTITLDPMGGILEEPYTRTFEYGASYTLLTISKPGYTFNGWTYNGNLISNSGKWNIAEDAVLIAKFTPIKYKITYSLSGGSASNPSTYTIEDAFTLNSPVKTGYTFAGWTGSNLSELSCNVVIQKGTTGDLSFEAHWDANKYTLSFDANGGTCSIESMEVTYGETFDIPTPRLFGYTFNGWYYNNTLIDGKTVWSYTNNICVVAKWTNNVTQFTFVYKNDGYELTDCIIRTGSEVLIPDTYNNKPVTAIGEKVFYNNKTITGINIPDSVKRIGSFNFVYCDNLQFNIDADGCRFLGNDLNPYMVQLSIPGKNGNYTIPNTTKILYSFGKAAETNGIKKLTLPAGLSISNSAYLNNSTLEELYICTGDIGTSLDFYKNQNLAYVYICKDVKSFARPIFAMCYNLDDIDFEGTINEWKAISKEDGWNAIDGGWAGDSAGTFHGTTKDITIHCSDGTYIEEGKTFK